MRVITYSRPNTGSSSPRLASSVRSRPKRCNAAPGTRLWAVHRNQRLFPQMIHRRQRGMVGYECCVRGDYLRQVFRPCAAGRNPGMTMMWVSTIKRLCMIIGYEWDIKSCLRVCDVDGCVSSVGSGAAFAAVLSCRNERDIYCTNASAAISCTGKVGMG